MNDAVGVQVAESVHQLCDVVSCQILRDALRETNARTHASTIQQKGNGVGEEPQEKR